MNEIKQMFGGVKIAENVWMEIIKEVDNNGDGQVIFFFYLKKRYHTKNLKL
jgi:hypothetical protein